MSQKQRYAVDSDCRFSLKGWILVPSESEKTASLLVSLDKAKPLPVRSRVERNFDEGGEALSRVKFHAIYPFSFYDGKSHEIEIKEALSGESIFKGSRGFADLNFSSQQSPRRKYVGCVFLVAKTGRIEGWIVDKDAPKRPVPLDLIVDGQHVRRDFAHLTMPNMLVGGDGRHGFRIQIPNHLADGQEHRFEVQADGATLPSVAGVFEVSLSDARHKVDGLGAFYARFEGAGFRGLRGVVKADSKNDAEISLSIGDEAASSISLMQSVDQGFVDICLPIPDKYYDGNRKSLSVRVGQTVVHTASAVLPARHVETAKILRPHIRNGQFRARLSIASDWAVEGQVGLFTNGVRVAVFDLDPRAVAWGSPAPFTLDLGALASTPWLEKPLEIGLIHTDAPRVDVRGIFVQASVVVAGEDGLTIEPPVPVTGVIRVGLDLADGGRREVDLTCLGDRMLRVALEPDEIQQADRLKVSLNGYPVSASRAAPIEQRSPSSVKITAALDPSAADVRQAIEALGFGRAHEPSPETAGKVAGAWELVSPNKVAGWAVDLDDPNHILSIALHVGGQDVAVVGASRPTQLADFGVRIARGFEIDFTRVDVSAEMHSFDLRFAGTDILLHPQTSLQLAFPGRSRAANLIEEVDDLVASGKILDAFVISANQQDEVLATRHLILDAMLRLEWSYYDQFVDRFETTVPADRLNTLKAFKGLVVSNDLADLPRLIEDLDAPQYYADAFEQSVSGRDLNKGGFAAAYAQWIAQAQLAQTPAAQETESRLAVVDLTNDGSVQAGGLPTFRLSQGARASLAEGAATAGAAAELAMIASDADWLLFLGEPRTIPQEVGEIWPRVLQTRGGCDVTVISSSIRPGVLPTRGIDPWSILAKTEPVNGLIDAARATIEGVAHCLVQGDETGSPRGELALLVSSSRSRSSQPSRYVCLHDFKDTADLPAMPEDVALLSFDWSTQGGLPSHEQVMSSATRLLDREGGVIILSSRLRYPADYVWSCVRHFARHPGGVAFQGARYDVADARIKIGAHDGVDETSLALSPLGCFPLSKLAASSATGLLGELRIVEGDQPIHLVEMREFSAVLHRGEIGRDLAEGCTPSEHEAGFRSALRERHDAAYWRFQNHLKPQKPGITEELISALAEMGLETAIEQLESGDATGARATIANFIASRDFRLPDEREALKLVLSIVRISGQQDALARALFSQFPQLVEAHPSLTKRLFENAAFALDPEELSALVLSCAAVILSPGAFENPLRDSDGDPRDAILAASAGEVSPTSGPVRKAPAKPSLLKRLLKSGRRQLAAGSPVPTDVQKHGPASAPRSLDGAAHDTLSGATEPTGQFDQPAETPRERALQALCEACQKYCGPSVMVMLLASIDRSEFRSKLSDEKLRRVLGAAFIGGAEAPFQLSNSKLTAEDLRTAAPKELRLITSLLKRSRAEFLQLLNEMLAEQGDLITLAKSLRTYTNELRDLGIQGREIHYPSDRSAEELVQFALIIGDTEMASIHMTPRATTNAAFRPDALSIVWGSAQADYSALNQALGSWYAPLEIAPLNIAGADILALFSSIFEGHDLPPARSRGKVSIICTVYNPDIELLHVAIKSMLAQTYNDIEVIVVDDASEPQFAREIEAAASLDPRIRTLRSSRNAGPYHGRNLALETASGDFIAIQDGDDVAHPQRLELQVNALADEPVYQMATTGHLRIDTRGQIQFEHTLDIVGDGTMTSMFRKSLFDQIGNFASVRSRGDVEFRERVRRALGKHVISHADVPMLFCLATPASLSNHTAARYGSFLSLYRDAFAKRMLRSHLQSKACGTSDAPLRIPYPLRSTTSR